MYGQTRFSRPSRFLSEIPSELPLLPLLLGLPGAYVLYRCRFPGRGLVRALVTIPFVLPTVVVGVAFRALLAEGGLLGVLGLDGTFPAIVLALVFFNYAVWESVEDFKRAFGNPEFQAKMKDYPPSAAASPHLVKKVAVPGICVD